MAAIAGLLVFATSVILALLLEILQAYATALPALGYACILVVLLVVFVDDGPTETTETILLETTEIGFSHQSSLKSVVSADKSTTIHESLVQPAVEEINPCQVTLHTAEDIRIENESSEESDIDPLSLFALAKDDNQEEEEESKTPIVRLPVSSPIIFASEQDPDDLCPSTPEGQDSSSSPTNPISPDIDNTNHGADPKSPTGLQIVVEFKCPNQDGYYTVSSDSPYYYRLDDEIRLMIPRELMEFRSWYDHYESKPFFKDMDFFHPGQGHGRDCCCDDCEYYFAESRCDPDEFDEDYGDEDGDEEEDAMLPSPLPQASLDWAIHSGVDEKGNMYLHRLEKNRRIQESGAKLHICTFAPSPRYEGVATVVWTGSGQKPEGPENSDGRPPVILVPELILTTPEGDEFELHDMRDLDGPA